LLTSLLVSRYPAGAAPAWLADRAGLAGAL
jgi:hypothetical protein